MILETLAAAILAVLAALWYGRRSGAAAERKRQADDGRKAKTVADEIDDAIAGRSPDANREELRKWSKP